MSGLSPGGTRSVASVFCAHPSAAMTKHGPRQKRRPRGTVALHRVFPLEGRAPSRPSWWAHLSSPWRDVLRHVRLLRASCGGHDKTWAPSEEAATRDRALHRVFPLEGRAPSRPSSRAHRSFPWRDALRRVRLLRASFGGNDEPWPPSEEAATRDRGPPWKSPGGTRSVASVLGPEGPWPSIGRLSRPARANSAKQGTA